MSLLFPGFLGIHGFQATLNPISGPGFQMSMCWYKQDGGQPSVLKINVWSKGITKHARALFFPPPFSFSSSSSSFFFFFFFVFLEGEFKECGTVSRGYEWKAFGNVGRNWAEGAASDRNSPRSFWSRVRNHQGSSYHTKEGRDVVIFS